MSVVEQPCYTLINLPTDSEPPNEMQLKQDLGELWQHLQSCTDLQIVTFTYPLELHLTTSELWFGQEQEGILP